MTCMYILRSSKWPGQLYVGVTSDLLRRLNYHNTGRSLHTAKFGPWIVVYLECFAEQAAALRRERQIKGWTRAKKEALIAGDQLRLKDPSRCKGRVLSG